MSNKITEAVKSISTRSGATFGDFLALMLIYFKITGQIHLSWFWVVSPIWISMVGGLLLVTFFAFLGVLIGLIKD